MKDITKLNPLTDPLITLAIPALILMYAGGTEHLDMVKELMFALALLLVWSMHELIHRKKMDLFAIPGMLFLLRTGGGCLLRIRLKAQTEPQTAFATATEQRIRP